MINPVEPIWMSDLFKLIKRDLGPDAKIGATEFYISRKEDSLATFDDLRLKVKLSKSDLKKLTSSARFFAEGLSAGEFDRYLSQSAYATLHPANSTKVVAEDTPSLPSPVYSPPASPPQEQPRPTAPPSPLETGLTTPAIPEAKAEPDYSPPDKTLRNFSLLGLAENLRSSESSKEKRTADLLGKLSAKLFVSNLSDITAKKIGVDDLEDADFDTVERHLLADYLDDKEATIRPTLRVHPNNLTHRITDATIKSDVEGFVRRHRVDTIEELASKSYADLLQQGLSTEGAMALSGVLEKHYRTELGSVKFDRLKRIVKSISPPVTPQPTAPVPPLVRASDTKTVSARPLFASPLPTPRQEQTSEPEADAPLVANPNYDKPVQPKTIQKPVDKSGLPSYLLSMSAADATGYMHDNGEKASIQSALSKLRFPDLGKVIRMSNDMLRDAGATQVAINSFRSVLETNYLNVKKIQRQQDEIYRNSPSEDRDGESELEELVVEQSTLQPSPKPYQPGQPQKELRGYSVVKVEDDATDKKVLVDGREVKIIGRANHEQVYQTFLLHSEGKSISEIKERLFWSNPNNVKNWLIRGGVFPQNPEKTYLDERASAYVLGKVFAEVSAANAKVHGDGSRHRAPPLNPLSSMPSLGALSYKPKGKK
ncbi:MAG: hypothetical protein AABX35_01590 [Nanoarchaeota archaeon]